jgi:hypothetical protein
MYRPLEERRTRGTKTNVFVVRGNGNFHRMLSTPDGHLCVRHDQERRVVRSMTKTNSDMHLTLTSRAKYPLAITNRLLQDVGAKIGCAYDIGCAFDKTLVDNHTKVSIYW